MSSERDSHLSPKPECGKHASTCLTAVFCPVPICFPQTPGEGPLCSVFAHPGRSEVEKLSRK